MTSVAQALPPTRQGDAEEPGIGDDSGSRRPGRSRRTTLAVTVAGGVFTALCLLVLFSVWRDDISIDTHEARTAADVLSVSFNRTAVRFATPDGTVYTPASGVLYPRGLAVGERVWVEYDTANPDLVRVAGRDYHLAFLPVGTGLCP